MVILKRYSSILLLFLSVGLFAQGTAALARVDSLTQLGEYKNAILSAEQFLETEPRNFARSLAYYRLSKAHLELDELDLARDYNKESLSIKEQINYEYFADNILLFGMIELVDGDPVSALDYFLEAESLPHESILFSAQLERNIGIAYFYLDSLEAAEMRFNNALDLLKWEVGDIHPEIALTRIAQGRVFSSRGNFLEALKTFTIAQNMLRNLQKLEGQHGTLFYDALLEWLYWHENTRINSALNSLNHRTLKDQLLDDEALLIRRSNDLYECTFATTKNKTKAVLKDHSRNMRSVGVENPRYELISLPKDQYVERAHELYEVFITPVSSVLDGAKRLTIVKTSGLQNLEYSAFLRLPASASEGYEDFDFLGEHYLLRYENSLEGVLLPGLSGSSKASSVNFSEDFPKMYKWRVKWKFKRQFRKGANREEALHETRLWMMGHRKLAAPKIWLGIS
jgi:tetratricopeptide (TPR) repeat protein